MPVREGGLTSFGLGLSMVVGHRLFWQICLCVCFRYSISEPSQSAMRKTEAVSYLKLLTNKSAKVRSILSDIEILTQHEDHSIQSASKFKDEIDASSNGGTFVVTVDYKSNTEINRWRGDVFDSYSPPTIGIFGVRIDHNGSTCYLDLVTPPVSHSAETALFLLEHGLVQYFKAKSVKNISVDKVSVWADCARHFRCGSFVHGALELLEGSYFLSKERSVIMKVACALSIFVRP